MRMDVNILVIKLGALGDMVQALGPMAAIRRYHADVQVTALTTVLQHSCGDLSHTSDDVSLPHQHMP